MASVARLLHLASMAEHYLSPRHLIGRAPACHLRVNDSSVSGFHAEIFWDGERWFVQDLGSRNGTALAERSLAKGEQEHFARGAELVLAEGIRFQLVDDSPPSLCARSAEGVVRVGEDELLSLPSDEAPEVTIYRDLDGRWLIESAAEIRTLDETVSVMAGETTWKVIAPQQLPATRELSSDPLIHDHTFCFSVSRDGEHVELQLESRRRMTKIESRVHLSLLLVLARERLRDANNPKLVSSERGWVYREDLPRLLGVQPELINLWTHRARKQLARAGLRDAAAIFERRAGNTQVRLGAAHLRIEDR